MSIFTLEKTSINSSARAGILKSAHGEIRTPFFMPVGTYGSVKAMSSEGIAALPSAILLSNTYHLFLRPGTAVLESAGGLHKFMNWHGAILTDSGGFQIFSLASFRKISEDGVEFHSHLSGDRHFFTPERVVDIQRSIGSDFMMMLDICPPGDADYHVWKEAVNKTSRWAKRGMAHYHKTEGLYGYKQVLLPIVQGGTSEALRRESAKVLIDLNAEAYAIGGLAVGEEKQAMMDTTELMAQVLPKDCSRYLMGVGTPADLVRCVARGIDMFDCVMPTRNARNGQIFTLDGKVNVKREEFKNDNQAIDDSGISPMSGRYSRAYLRHLVKTGEILGARICTEHNLRFYIWLMATMREEILKHNFENWANSFLLRYEGKRL